MASLLSYKHLREEAQERTAKLLTVVADERCCIIEPKGAAEHAPPNVELGGGKHQSKSQTHNTQGFCTPAYALVQQPSQPKQSWISASDTCTYLHGCCRLKQNKSSCKSRERDRPRWYHPTPPEGEFSKTSRMKHPNCGTSNSPNDFFFPTLIHPSPHASLRLLHEEALHLPLPYPASR